MPVSFDFRPLKDCRRILRRIRGILQSRQAPVSDQRLAKVYDFGPLRMRGKSLKTVIARINADNLRHNAFQLKKMCGFKTRLCAVVKANAYGHDARLAVSNLGVDLANSFMVSTIEEAEQIHHLTGGRSILVTCPLYDGIDRELIRLAKARQFHCSVCTEDALHYVSDILSESYNADNPTRLRVHLKVDTGMTRLGCNASDSVYMAEALSESRYVKLAGIYSHMATADDNAGYADEQLKIYQQVLKNTAEWTDYRSVIKHFCNTAGSIAMPQARYDMIRCGLGLYGYASAPGELDQQLDLKPVLKVIAPVVLTRKIAAGRAVGYGCSYTAPHDMTIGVIPVGYADGFFRAYSNKAVLRCNGFDAPVIGKVSMDLTVLDLSRVPQASEGMAVTVIDDDKTSPCSAENLAKIADTIPYEVFIAIGNRVKRELVHDEEIAE